LTPAPSTPKDEASALVRGIADLALEKQAENVIALDVRGITSKNKLKMLLHLMYAELQV